MANEIRQYLHLRQSRHQHQNQIETSDEGKAMDKLNPKLLLPNQHSKKNNFFKIFVGKFLSENFWIE